MEREDRVRNAAVVHQAELTYYQPNKAIAVAHAERGLAKSADGGIYFRYGP